VRRVWLQVALAAGAGLASLVGCSGAFVAIFLLLFVGPGGYMVWLGRLNLPLFLFGVVVALLLLLALASLSLSARALGAGGGHLTKTTLLSGLGICAFVFLSLGAYANVALAAFALVALVATPVVGSLLAVREEGPLAVRLGRATVIAAVAIYCASLLAWWAYGAADWPYYLAPWVVASLSWAVIPGIVALLRPG
jgi:hypothetical protein